MNSIEYFWNRVDSRSLHGCWEWQGHIPARGYGVTTNRHPEWYAHRLSWHIHNGPIPEGRHILHKCDNPPCVNPAHLFIGDQVSNNADRDAKGRTSHASRNKRAAHGMTSLTEANVSAIRSRVAAGESQASLEREFGMKRGGAWPIVHGINWK